MKNVVSVHSRGVGVEVPPPVLVFELFILRFELSKMELSFTLRLELSQMAGMISVFHPRNKKSYVYA